MLGSVPEVRRDSSGVTIEWRGNETARPADPWVFPGTIQENATYSFVVPSALGGHFVGGKDLNGSSSAPLGVTVPQDVNPEAQGRKDMQDLLRTFLTYATSADDARTEALDNPTGEWYKSPAGPSEAQRRVQSLYDQYEKSKTLLPPLHRHKTEQGETIWRVGRGWRYPISASEQDGESVPWSDGQAALKFRLGTSAKFELYLPRDAEKVLQEKELLSVLVKSLSTSPTDPEPITDWKEDSVKSTDYVIHWGGRQPHSKETSKIWYDGLVYYHVVLPTGVEAALRNDGQGGRAWGQMHFFLARCVLAIAEARLDLSPVPGPTEVPFKSA
ncbi:hypothetical protein CSUI_000119 [Cystoisospora suis]|uniref:Uncharacterized protein n=1 Tax=Cystoisospora suis TaxID=483139 RepID=A0A2C6LI25_9APIC|nr:hypothetical protein CSUI_000119 [Cystoisospora suis]